MKIETEVSFSEAQKLKIVSRGEHIPSGYVTFEMSNQHVKILESFCVGYQILNDVVRVTKSVNFYDGNYHHSFTKTASDMLACGDISEGDNIDNSVVAHLNDVIEKHRVKVAESAKAKKIADEKYIKNAPVREWEVYNLRVLNDLAAKIIEDNKAMDRAAADKVKAEKLAWINEFGSDKLKEGVRQGYNCRKIYALETGQSVLGESYSLDYDGNVPTKDRSCPSLEALHEVTRLKERDIQAKIVWLPEGLSEITHDHEDSTEAIEVILEGNYWYCEM